jgi:hypothetical protein
MENNTIDLLKIILYVLFSIFGGVIGYVLRALDSNTKILFSRLIIEALSAGFVGTLVYMICLELSLQGNWPGIIIGVSGWLGASQTIRIIEATIMKKFKLFDKDKES